MAWSRVESYSFWFYSSDQQFWLYDTLEGSSTATQLFLTAAPFSALAQLFGAANGVNFETTGKYFATVVRQL